MRATGKEDEGPLTLIPRLAVELLMLRTRLIRLGRRVDPALELVLSRLLNEIQDRIVLLTNAAETLSNGKPMAAPCGSDDGLPETEVGGP